MELKLRLYPDPILRERSDTITEFDDDLLRLADAMVQVMHAQRGIGLAAPQVGVSKRLIVVLQMTDSEDGGAPPLVLVNPRVVESGGDVWVFEEGCLSIPGVNATVRRPTLVEVEYEDLQGNTQRVRNEKMLARILQHEIDHLDGRLFIDYLSTAQKSIIRPKLKALVDEYSS